MPFTLAHPAAILPLRGIPSLHGITLVRTAPLIIGAMIPDTPYYLPASVLRTAAAVHHIPDTHTLEGTLTTCLLLGYLACDGSERQRKCGGNKRSREQVLHQFLPFVGCF